MADLRDEIGHEIAALYSFVDRIVRCCDQLPGPAAYTASSERFFDYIVGLGNRTKEYLSAFPVDLSAEGEDFTESRRELLTIRSSWKELHLPIKPATDADTLNQPAAFLEALVRRFRHIPGFEETEFVIFHTAEFNYLQIYATSIREAADKLAKTITPPGGSPPTFPKSLGLIGLPNSQSSALFLNCLITHEMGHYVFAERRLRTHMLGEAIAALQGVLKESFAQLTASRRSALAGTLATWAEELFCDLFAIGLVGPCYSLAYIELYDQLHLLGPDGTISSKQLTTGTGFYEQHPSHPFRVQQQAKMLQSLGWADYFDKIDSRYTRLLCSLRDIKEARFAVGENASIVQSFIEILPEVTRKVGEAVGGLDTCVHEFSLIDSAISDYLERGVVPSSLVLKANAAVHVATPSLVTLLNSSFKFLLSKMPALMGRIADQDPRSIADRVRWMRRIEEWVTKAIEDTLLLTGVPPNGVG